MNMDSFAFSRESKAPYKKGERLIFSKNLKAGLLLCLFFEGEDFNLSKTASI